MSADVSDHIRNDPATLIWPGLPSRMGSHRLFTVDGPVPTPIPLAPGATGELLDCYFPCRHGDISTVSARFAVKKGKTWPEQGLFFMNVVRAVGQRPF